jgi:hypothetical protein
MPKAFLNCGFLTPPEAGFGMKAGKGEYRNDTGRREPE